MAGTIGNAIAMDGREKMADDGEAQQKEYLREITLSRLFVIGSTRHAIRATNVQDLVLTDSTIHIRDLGGVRSDQQLFSGVYLTGDDMLVKGCEVRVVEEGAGSEDLILAQNARGGIQIGPGSERVSITGNVITCGIGNGITLGGMEWEKNGQAVAGPAILERDFISRQETLGQFRPQAGASLRDISIESNHISFMGLNGIGIPAFFEIKYVTGMNQGRVVFAVSNLTIEKNHIDSCAWIEKDTPDEMLPWMGRGGIALGYTSDLVIRDNDVINNGIDYRRAVCGIYVNNGDGVEISRNRVFGPVGADSGGQGKERLGARGGIWIEKAMRGLIIVNSGAPFSLGTPALKIQENIVSVRLGRSLTAQIKGPVSVTNNSFTTFNAGAEGFFDRIQFFVAGNQAATTRTAFMLMDMMAGNVFISDQSLVIAVERIFADLLPKKTTTLVPGRRFIAVREKTELMRAANFVFSGQTSTTGTILGSTTGTILGSTTTGTNIGSTAGTNIGSTAGTNIGSTAGTNIGSTTGTILGSTTGTILGSTAGTNIGSIAGNILGSTASPSPGTVAGATSHTTVGSPLIFQPATGILLSRAGASPLEAVPAGASAGSMLAPGMRFTSGTVLTHGTTLPGSVFTGPLILSATAFPIGTIGPIGIFNPIPVLGVPPPLNPLRASEPRYFDSNILFTDNQCFQDNATCGSCSSVVSVLIVCDKDAGVHNNQVSCRLTDHMFPNQRRGSFPMINTYVRGRTCRTSNNRFTESIDETHLSDNRIDIFSAFTDGHSDISPGMNITTDNIATHCLKVLGGLFLDNYNLIEIERNTGDQMQSKDRWCKRKREGTTVVFPTADPPRFTNMLDDLLAVDLGNDFNFQTAKTEAFRVEQMRAELRFGQDHQRTVAMRQMAYAGAAQVELAAGEFFAASTPMAEAGKGWLVDGFVRTPGGIPVNRLTVAAYDDKGNWRKEFGHTCTDENGHFLLKVENIPAAPAPAPALAPTPVPVFLPISERDNFIPSNEVKLTPAAETSHRVEIVVQHDPEHVECSRPPGASEPDPGPKPAPPPAGKGKGGSGSVLEATPPEEKEKPVRGRKKAPPPEKKDKP